MNSNEIALLLGIVTVISVLSGFIGGIYFYDFIDNSSIYSEENKCDLILEQRVASSLGCNILKQKIRDSGILGNLGNYTLFKLWDDTHDYLDNRYYLEFDEFGDISFCEYNHEVE